MKPSTTCNARTSRSGFPGIAGVCEAPGKPEYGGRCSRHRGPTPERIAEVKAERIRKNMKEEAAYLRREGQRKKIAEAIEDMLLEIRSCLRSRQEFKTCGRSRSHTKDGMIWFAKRERKDIRMLCVVVRELKRKN